MSEIRLTVQEVDPEAVTLQAPGSLPSFRISAPQKQAVAMLVASPHSGRDYPAGFVSASRLGFNALRRSEDSFVDELFASAPMLGIPLLQAEFPRAFCDVNREPWELDPVMFSDALPSWCNTSSARVSAGFGTIARLVASGEPIYGSKLDFAEAEHRIRVCWQPYHAALAALIDETIARDGICLLVDAHSMPSLNGVAQHGASRAASERTVPTAGGRRLEPDFVLGDAFGTSCSASVTRCAERYLRDNGFKVRRNDPYAGGYVTRHYGRPSQRVHVLQVEIGRSLYMDEQRYERSSQFGFMQATMAGLLERLADLLPVLIGE